ncbi:serine hydrolase domain-containing protein [Kitasatospora sp. NPDC089913]|uniref:serine hydrolase domain-containing protein n=1 Tax=Kitasatospora sp. NPDC089913 TaxID=3364080 RepID=UPI0037F337A8
MTREARLGLGRVRGRSLLALAPFLGALAAAVCWVPAPPSLGPATSGDPAVADLVREAAGDGHGYRGLAVVVVDQDRVRTAGLGSSGNDARPIVDAATVFEAGSIGKPLTGMLLADLADRELLDLSTPLRNLRPEHPFAPSGPGDVTLEDLATHRGGMTKMPPALDTTLRDLSLRILGRDPYRGLDEDDVLNGADTAHTGPDHHYAYSNIGMALAGLTAAHHLRLPYEQLLQERLLTPLGMTGTHVVRPTDPLPPASAHGQRADGPPMDHWFASGYTPAGDLWTTSGDLGRLLKALLDGNAPGSRATEPRYPAGPGARTGLGWFTDTRNDRRITWHNGATGGFTSYLALDPDRGLGVAVLSNTDRPVDAIGHRLLGLAPQPHDDEDTTTTLATIALTAAAPLPAAAVAARHRTHPPRATVLALDAAFALTALTITRRLGHWLTVPPPLWTVALLLTGSALARTLLEPRAPATAKSHPSLPARTGALFAVLAAGTAALL